MALLTTPGLWLQRITTQPPSERSGRSCDSCARTCDALEKAQGGELVIA